MELFRTAESRRVETSPDVRWLTNPVHRIAARLARLLLALALVYTWLLLWGAYVIATGQHKLVDNVRTPTLSVFQTGLRFVMRLWQRGQLRKFHWHLSMLAEANNC